MNTESQKYIGSFWDRHPFLKKIGTRCFAWLGTFLSVGIAVLTYFKIDPPENIKSVLIIIGASVVCYCLIVGITYILDLLKIVKLLRKEIATKNNEIIAAKKLVLFRDKQIDFLKNKMHPDKQKLFDLVSHFASIIDPKNTEDFEFVLKMLWEISDQKSLNNFNNHRE